MAGIFKAYDIRGTYPDQLDEALARKIGIATVLVLSAKSMVVGRDMRESGPAVRDALIDGITATGCDVIDIDMCSTPTTYWAVNHFDADGAIMITASHNPAGYNGFKISGRQAVPVSYETGIADIEKRIEDGNLDTGGTGAGSVQRKPITCEYQKWLMDFAGEIKPFKVCIDTGNGIMGGLLPSLLEKLPIKVTPLFFEVDGTFPNHEANPLKEENMRDLIAAVKDSDADLGVAFDGDGDRAMYVDENGKIIPCDYMTALLTGDFLEREPGATIIYDLRSSWVVKDEIERLGGTPVESRVGHSFIKQTMRETGAIFAGELSGHFYFRDAFVTDNGEVAFLTVLTLLSRMGKPMSELIAPYAKYFATGEINFEVDDKDAKMQALEEAFSDAGAIEHLDGVSIKYQDWWCNVRPSNTEPVLRLNLEARTPELRETMRKKVEAILKG